MEIGQQLLKDEQGVYRWVYELNMWKNPTIVITMLKIFMLCALFPALLLFFLEVGDGFLDAFMAFLQVYGIVVGIMLGLLVIAYPVITLINGGKYCVVFEMDDVGVRHTQMQKQFKKNQVLAMITVVAGLATGSVQTAGAGLLAGTKNSSYSKFSRVNKIEASPKRHVIYVNTGLNHNQVYVDKENFEEVLAYIIEHCKKVESGK